MTVRLVVVNAFRITLLACLIVFTIASPSASAQRKSKKKPPPAQPVTELTKLRDEYVKLTNEYKTSLEN